MTWVHCPQIRMGEGVHCPQTPHGGIHGCTAPKRGPKVKGVDGNRVRSPTIGSSRWAGGCCSRSPQTFLSGVGRLSVRSGVVRLHVWRQTRLGTNWLGANWPTLRCTGPPETLTPDSHGKGRTITPKWANCLATGVETDRLTLPGLHLRVGLAARMARTAASIESYGEDGAEALNPSSGSLQPLEDLFRGGRKCKIRASEDKSKYTVRTSARCKCTVRTRAR